MAGGGAVAALGGFTPESSLAVHSIAALEEGCAAVAPLGAAIESRTSPISGLKAAGAAVAPLTGSAPRSSCAHPITALKAGLLRRYYWRYKADIHS